MAGHGSPSRDRTLTDRCTKRERFLKQAESFEYYRSKLRDAKLRPEEGNLHVGYLACGALVAIARRPLPDILAPEEGRELWSKRHPLQKVSRINIKLYYSRLLVYLTPYPIICVLTM